MLRGRFNKEMTEQVKEYNASISFDRRLFRQDIQGSIAHATMLAKQGIITPKESQLIVKGLTQIRKDIEQGKFVFKKEHEDIHLNIESRLAEIIGDVSGKLHTARSRNDQVALDIRLYTKEVISETLKGIKQLQVALLDIAEANIDAIMPGYTHMQRAQPVLFAHHMLAYFEMLSRDVDRFNNLIMRVDVMPLGSGALAGLPYTIDRNFVASELGFSKVSENSIDAVSDRDFLIEYISDASISMMHLSRLAEELIIWSTAEFGFIEIDDAYTTSSSIMPQKKNPDVAELARGKTGRVYGNLVGILTLLKALPLAYNKDLQEDKEGFFDTVDTLLSTIEVFTGMISTLKINAEKMRVAAGQSYTLATDVADYLVKKGSTFRQAHQIVAELVKYSVEKGKALSELNLSEYKKFSPLFGKDIKLITIESSIAARSAVGGTAPDQVNQAISKARNSIEK
ncbi:MAG: argininosuccinate lyase [Chloroflexi bacterium]|nr:argininosuccinate lyase [Chloroflexota bacterium]